LEPQYWKENEKLKTEIKKLKEKIKEGGEVKKHGGTCGFSV